VQPYVAGRRLEASSDAYHAVVDPVTGETVETTRLTGPADVAAGKPWHRTIFISNAQPAPEEN
jgi:hypothetical protein